MKKKVKGRILAILMSLAMVFTMMPMIGGAVYADDTDLYTVTILPGEGTGDPLTIYSTTILTNDEARGDGYDKTRGCFYYHYSSGDIEYKLPSTCGFTAPQGKELEGWQSNGGVLNGHTHDPGAECPLSWIFDDGSKSATITAQWKDVEPDPTIEYSTPESINVNYGETHTAFDIQVTDASFTQGVTECHIQLIDSTFTCSENGGSIPFIIDVNGEKRDTRDGRAWNSVFGDFYCFHYIEGSGLSDTLQASINISSDAWAAAEPGEYTATLKIHDNFGGDRNIPMTLTVPDKNAVHTVTVTNNGNGTASADPQSGTWGTEVTLTATPNPGCVFKEWQVISGGVTVSNDKFTIRTDDVEIKAIFVKPVDVPEGKTLTYNGEEQSGVEAGEGYELINASATNADSYEATATLKDGYVWADDGTTDPKTIPWKINKAIAEDKVAIPTGDTLTYNGKAQTGVVAGERYTLTDASAINAGDYTAKATLKTDPNYIYEWTDGSTGMQEIPWKINKAIAEDKVAIPTGDTLTYNGKAQTGVAAGERYTLTDASATNAGDYTAKATLKTDPNYIYEWTDGSTGMQEIPWKINKASVKVTAPAGKTFTYNGKAQTGVASGANYTLSGTVKATKAGTFTTKATLKTNANYVYKWSDGTTAVKSIKWKINKAANPLTIKAKTATVKGSTKGKNGKLKKTKTLAVSKVIAFTKKGQGKMTYIKSSGSKKITIAKTTGKVTVKKGLKKGTYKVKVKVKAAGNANYKASAWKTVTFKIKVK